MQKINKDQVVEVRNFLLELQNNIISMICSYDNSEFNKDNWSRDEGGGGITCVLQNGNVFDKVGVNFSDIFGSSWEILAEKNARLHLPQKHAKTNHAGRSPKAGGP